VDSKLTFKGGRELQRELKKLDEKVERKIAVSANRSAATMLKKMLAAELPTGDSDDHLKDSLAVRKERGRDIRHVVGVTGQARAYAHIIEFGSKYVAPNPVWRRVMESNAQEIFDEMAAKLWKGIRKENG
jgi:HK97 gp10 family phage protein